MNISKPNLKVWFYLTRNMQGPKLVYFAVENSCFGTEIAVTSKESVIRKWLWMRQRRLG